MKKKIPLLLLSLSISIPLLNKYIDKAEIKVEATSSSLVEIGKLYDFERVSQTTKVIVSGESKEMAERAGREIFSEIVETPFQPGDPITPISSTTQADINIITPPVIRRTQYYYWATTTEPKITGETTMYNDYQSLVKAVSYLEDIAAYEIANNFRTYRGDNKTNIVLGYIRCINTEYYYHEVEFPGTDFAIANGWDFITGESNSYFRNAVNSLNPGGMLI